MELDKAMRSPTLKEPVIFYTSDPAERHQAKGWTDRPCVCVSVCLSVSTLTSHTNEMATKQS